MDEAETDVLAYMGFPADHWPHSTNGLERLNGEIKRRTEVVDHMGALAHEVLAFACRPFGVLFVEPGYDRRAAVSRLSSPRAEQHAHEKRRVEPVRLRTGRSRDTAMRLAWIT